MNKIILNKIHKNIRYRTFEWQNKVYLLDCDSNIRAYLFPILAYFTIYKCYELSDKASKNLTYSSPNSYRFFSVGLTSFLITTILRRRLVQNLQSSIPNIEGIVKIVLLLMSFIFIISLRVLYSQKLSLDLQGGENSYIRVRIVPVKWKNVFGKTLSYVLILFIVLAMIYGIITSDEVNYLIILGLNLFVLLLSFSNISVWDFQEYHVFIKE
ncbi:TPA: DUF443 family protein [Streptococcus suis]|nr:DUF443 family protein [Streptococcus suis]HEM3615404.1 DUF443 family protein [Streptococcus suis]HEM3622242.1 DUF443 family protein [Streptococcus suis]HEM3627113.1 DUF443 family protein [Streptococcus suis]HEM3631113.1 DUF443 family protein [Streptococcus suis]